MSNFQNVKLENNHLYYGIRIAHTPVRHPWRRLLLASVTGWAIGTPAAWAWSIADEPGHPWRLAFAVLVALDALCLGVCLSVRDFRRHRP